MVQNLWWSPLCAAMLLVLPYQLPPIHHKSLIALIQSFLCRHSINFAGQNALKDLRCKFAKKKIAKRDETTRTMSQHFKVTARHFQLPKRSRLWCNTKKINQSHCCMDRWSTISTLETGGGLTKLHSTINLIKNSRDTLTLLESVSLSVRLLTGRSAFICSQRSIQRHKHFVVSSSA